MNYPLEELIDRLSITQLKIERIPILEDKGVWFNAVREYSTSIGEYIGNKDCTHDQIEEWSEELYSINGQIWDLEADIRQGKNIALDEVGRRAISIREHNKIRVGIKNKIIKIIKKGYPDIKINHGSA